MVVYSELIERSQYSDTYYGSYFMQISSPLAKGPSSVHSQYVVLIFVVDINCP